MGCDFGFGIQDNGKTIISIHAPRVGCDQGDVSSLGDRAISIHAPRVGCDLRSLTLLQHPKYFNPRTPGGVRREMSFAISCNCTISIHAPRVGCDVVDIFLPPSTAISIHAPRVGCDSDSGYRITAKLLFQSTHPGWGATVSFASSQYRQQISIHAPRVGCDTHANIACDTNTRFQSTHPGWGATPSQYPAEIRREFQSTHPGWGATPPR